MFFESEIESQKKKSNKEVAGGGQIGNNVTPKMGPEIADVGQPADRNIEFVNPAGVVGNNAFDPDKIIFKVKK